MRRKITFAQLPLVTKPKLEAVEDYYYTLYWRIFSRLLKAKFNKQEVYTVPEFPLWITTLSNAVYDAGWEPRFVDFGGLIGPKSSVTVDTISERLAKEESDAYAFSPYTANYSITTAINNSLKERLKKSPLSFLGGAHATATANQCVADGFDVVVRGKGEECLRDSLLRWSDGGMEALTTVRGLTLRLKDGNAIQTDDQPKRGNSYIDRLPDYSLIPDDYKVHFARVYCSLGCPYGCTFCADTLWIRMQPYFKSIDTIINEIDGIRTRYGIDLFLFGDEVFTLYPEFVTKLCARLKAEGIKWFCQTRANLVDQRIMEIMANSGCMLVQIGAESADDNVLRLLNKRVNFATVKQACHFAKQAGLGVLTYWMVGAPGESHETALRTLSAIHELFHEKLTDVVDYYICTPYPGTEIYEHPDKFGVKIASKDFDRWREDQASVMSTAELSSEEIFQCWLNGLQLITEDMKYNA